MRYYDPNFSVDYKKVWQYEYIELESEPDVTSAIPTMLPLPKQKDLF
jgi:hypothetical protein